jgi:hypothetical protein
VRCASGGGDGDGEEVGEVGRQRRGCKTLKRKETVELDWTPDTSFNKNPSPQSIIFPTTSNTSKYVSACVIQSFTFLLLKNVCTTSSRCDERKRRAKWRRIWRLTCRLDQHHRLSLTKLRGNCNQLATTFKTLTNPSSNFFILLSALDEMTIRIYASLYCRPTTSPCAVGSGLACPPLLLIRNLEPSLGTKKCIESTESFPNGDNSHSRTARPECASRSACTCPLALG